MQGKEMNGTSDRDETQSSFTAQDKGPISLLEIFPLEEVYRRIRKEKKMEDRRLLEGRLLRGSIHLEDKHEKRVLRDSPSSRRDA